MYTAFDFINNCIPGNKMRFGWKVKIVSSGGITMDKCIVLEYTMLNFDWKSIEWLGEEAMNRFLDSDSYKNFKKRQERAMKKFKRLHYDAYSISELKLSADCTDLKIDIDKLIDKAVKRKSTETKKKIEENGKHDI